MKYHRVIILLCLLSLLYIIPVEAIDLEDWELHTINDEYYILIPPGWTYYTTDISLGPETMLTDPSRSDKAIAILRMTDPYGSTPVSDTVKKKVMADFLEGANITGISDPSYNENMIWEYGMTENGKSAIVLANFIDDDIYFIMGRYGYEDDILSDAEELGAIGGSITPYHPDSR